MTSEHDGPSDEQRQHDEETHRRVALPLLVPAIVFLFALLVIYGLSRIYLELNTYKVGDVTMATPLAIGVSLAILGAAAYLASKPRIARWQVGSIMAVAALAVTGGAIWAAVHEESTGEGPPVVETPNGDQTPSEGGIQVGLIDPEWAVTVNPESAPAGTLMFEVANEGTLVHNLRIAQTDLAPDALPVDAGTFQVDESQLTIAGSVEDFPGGQTESLSADLEAGSYVLFCNVPSHYENGMFTGFTVE